MLIISKLGNQWHIADKLFQGDTLKHWYSLGKEKEKYICSKFDKTLIQSVSGKLFSFDFWTK